MKRCFTFALAALLTIVSCACVQDEKPATDIENKGEQEDPVPGPQDPEDPENPENPGNSGETGEGTRVPLKAELTHVQPMTGIVLWTTSSSRNKSYVQLEFSYMLYSDVCKE